MMLLNSIVGIRDMRSREVHPGHQQQRGKRGTLTFAGLWLTHMCVLVTPLQGGCGEFGEGEEEDYQIDAWIKGY